VKYQQTTFILPVSNQRLDGKIVKKSQTGTKEGHVFIDIQLQDTTSCVIYVGPAELKVDRAQVIGWKKGNS
jgi:hypothetical protein